MLASPDLTEDKRLIAQRRSKLGYTALRTALAWRRAVRGFEKLDL